MASRSSEQEVFLRPGRDIQRATMDGGLSERVLYSSAAPETYRSLLVLQGLCRCDCCLISNAEKLRSQTYLTIYENKWEQSTPSSCYCWKFDNIRTMYFDSDEMRQVSKAECCSPCCTHCRFCPTCFDAFGEAVILHGGGFFGGERLSNSSANCQSLALPMCCCGWKVIYPVAKAKEISAILSFARKKSYDNARHHRSLAVPLTPFARASLRHETRSLVSENTRRISDSSDRSRSSEHPSAPTPQSMGPPDRGQSPLSGSGKPGMPYASPVED